ncbi:hypothetical protein JOF39_002333 [Glutamicibacter protophormiae]|uniref:Uncharacterized protein n=1 Tax=Glutamicibacter protophormiae TaxID=37930 RepID=A0ABS4XSK1_GLUPR|nr:hypothetical protein [Glutamicibacter protophormiae]GGL91736.1 hypothetical protein GCM10010038_22060 [Glutamicibacter protophormiae]
MVSHFGLSIGVFAVAATLAGSAVRLVLLLAVMLVADNSRALPRYHHLDVALDPALGINEGWTRACPQHSAARESTSARFSS